MGILFRLYFVAKVLVFKIFGLLIVILVDNSFEVKKFGLVLIISPIQTAI